MKRLSLAIAVILWAANAQACLLTTHVGACGNSGPHPITTPALVPLAGSYLNQASANGGQVTYPLKPNAGAAGSAFAPTTPQNSYFTYVEGQVDNALGSGFAGSEFLLGVSGSLNVSNNVSGQPAFLTQRLVSGVTNSLWWPSIGWNPTLGFNNGSATAGSNYANGYYPFTATGGGCTRNSTAVLHGTTISNVDPGFQCSSTETAPAVAAIPGTGAQQPTGVGGATTCVNNFPTSTPPTMTVTVHLGVAHGVAPGLLFTLSGFTPTGYNLATYTAMDSPTPTTLVGSVAGTCPAAVSVEGKALTGTGAVITMFPVPVVATTPYVTGQTGVSTKNGQHFCAAVGENGAESAFPGSQFFTAVDRNGAALAGAPALSTYLNQGSANFQGYTVAGPQSPSTPALTVTGMNAYVGTGAWASYSSGTGLVTFTTTVNPGFVPGSEFVVTGATPSGFNKAYVAVAGTSGTTVVGNPLSGPLGAPLANNPGASTGTGGQLVSVIMPGMQVLGSTGATVIAPFGLFGATGTGYDTSFPVTYALVNDQAAFANFNGSVTSNVLTLTSTPAAPLVAGSAITTTSGSTVIVNLLSGAGLSGSTYSVAAIANSVTRAITPAGTIGSVGTPVNIFAFPTYYQSAVPSVGGASGGGVLTYRTQAAIGDYYSVIGSKVATATGSNSAWGGSLANLADMWGQFPTTTGGVPDNTQLASICTKQQDLQTFAAAQTVSGNAMSVHSLYRMDTASNWSDSGEWTGTGYITGSSSTGTLNVSSTTSGGFSTQPTTPATVVGGPGIPGCPLACPTITSGSGSTFSLAWGSAIGANVGSVGSPFTIDAGLYKPVQPVTVNPFMGYIDNGGGSTPTLHVTSIPSANVANFTGTLGNIFTAGIVGSTMTVASVGNVGYASLTIGTIITGNASIPAGDFISKIATPTGTETGSGGVGIYTLNAPVTSTVATGTVLFGSGVLPGPAQYIQTSSPTGAALAAGMWVTDGGVNITCTSTACAPIRLGAATVTGPVGTTVWPVIPTYYSFSNDTTLTGNRTALAPGQYIQTTTTPGVGLSTLSTPTSIIGYGTGNGLITPSTYLLSTAPANVGSAGTPVAFLATGVGDAGAVAGGALTVNDLGAGTTFPVTNYATGTGVIRLTGTYDTAALGGTPTTLQAQVSYTPNGPPIPGCSACAWTNMAGYSATLKSGTIFDWVGQVANIPSMAAPMFVSVCAANGTPACSTNNGTAYATMPSLVKVGLIFDYYMEGQAANFFAFGGVVNSFIDSLWGQNSASNLNTGPPVTGGWSINQTIPTAGDVFSMNAVAEWSTVLQQGLWTALGWPVTLSNITRDGTSIEPQVMGGTPQNQTVSVGDGTSKTFCSIAALCGPLGSTPGFVSTLGALDFTAASLTGAVVTGSIIPGAGSPVPSGLGQMTTTAVLGSLQPGATLAITGSPTLVYCVTNCTLSGVPLHISQTQTWATSVSQTATLTAVRADTGASPMPAYHLQETNSEFSGGGFSSTFVAGDTFTVSVNGVLACQDNVVFAYNNQTGNCADLGSAHTVVSGSINYMTGDYRVTFSAAPATTDVITAGWKALMTSDGTNTPNTLSRAAQIDMFGTGGSQSGWLSSVWSKTPGGVNGHIFGSPSSESGFFQPYQTYAPGFSQMVAYLYSNKASSLIPGASATTPFIPINDLRTSGGNQMGAGNIGNAIRAAVTEQWATDSAMTSTFTGSIASNVLTLGGSAAVGDMWEGEVLGCAPFSLSCPIVSGTYILDLKTGTWGGAGSTYDLSSSATSTGSIPMTNAVQYPAGPTIFAGGTSDIPIQASLSYAYAANVAGQGAVGAHGWNGFTGGRRTAARFAANLYGGLTNIGGSNLPHAPNASDSTVDRVEAHATGCDAASIAAPCLDIGSTYAASHSATITGAAITVTGGIPAGALPFVVGQALSCSGCTAGRFITSIDVPSTASPLAGAGEVGQTFHITANASLLAGPTTETVTAGCSGTSGVGSNCIDVAFQQNTTAGTFGTAWSLATCGENNISGITGTSGVTPNFAPPGGKCQSNGIGSLVRDFRIGTQQNMWQGGVAGSPYDDGADPGFGSEQNSAFSCHIVAPKVVQCVKGATYTLVSTSSFTIAIGSWAPGTTFVEYGDAALGTGRSSTVMGNVGGQPFGFTAGSGYTSSATPYTITATCTSQATTPTAFKLDVWVVGGSIVNVYPTAQTTGAAFGNGLNGGCTFSLAALGGGTGGAINPLIEAPMDGVGGIDSYATDGNIYGDKLYDNTGIPGNPLNSFFTNYQGGYFEPGLPAQPFGEFLGLQVSG
jgi:hypothetical protein